MEKQTRPTDIFKDIIYILLKLKALSVMCYLKYYVFFWFIF